MISNQETFNLSPYMAIYDVAISAGLFGMQIQGAMAIFAVNLKRIRTLMKEAE